MDVNVYPMSPADVPLMVDYFLQAPLELLDRMGVDPERLPEREWWIDHVNADLALPLAERKYLYLVAEVSGEAVGHCNVNKVRFGLDAFMHLHLWQPDSRRSGVGAAMVRLSLPVFCRELELATIYCEPKANNEAPNRTLAKAGFEFVETYRTTPGWLNYEQEVNRWVFRCDNG